MAVQSVYGMTASGALHHVDCIGFATSPAIVTGGGEVSRWLYAYTVVRAPFLGSSAVPLFLLSSGPQRARDDGHAVMFTESPFKASRVRFSPSSADSKPCP